jgi:Aspartyl protease
MQRRRRMCLCLVSMTLVMLSIVFCAQPPLVAIAGPSPETASDNRPIGTVCVPIIKTRTGFFLVNATVGSKKLRFILDTGSSTTWVDKDRTKELNLVWKPTGVNWSGQDPFWNWDHSMNCEIRGLKFGALNTESIVVGAFDAYKANCTFVAHGEFLMIDGLLGADVLLKHSAMVDFGSMQLILHTSKSAAVPK